MGSFPFLFYCSIKKKKHSPNIFNRVSESSDNGKSDAHNIRMRMKCVMKKHQYEKNAKIYLQYKKMDESSNKKKIEENTK